MKSAPGAKVGGLDPEVQRSLDQLDQMVKDLGGQLRINSGYRSPQDQQKLFANRANNPNPVAPPGQSEHQQGTAVDMGVIGITQKMLADLAKQVNLRWAGPHDPVHFSYDGELSQTNGQHTNRYEQAMSELKRRQPDYRHDPDLDAILANNQPQPPQQSQLSHDPDLDQIVSGQPQQPGFIDRAKNYWSNWYNSVVHGETNQGQPLGVADRLKAAGSPLGQAADYVLGGGIGAATGLYSGGLLTGAGRVLNAGEAGVSELGSEALNSANAPGGMPDLSNVSLRHVASQVGKGWSGEVQANPLLDIPMSTESGRAFLTAHPFAQELLKLGQLGVDWEVMPELMKPLAPVFRVGGRMVRLGTDTAAAGLDTLAGRLTETQPGLSRFINKANNGSLGFKTLTNASPELRKMQEYVHTNQQEYSAAKQALQRVTNTVMNIGRKLQGNPDVTLNGDLLASHPDPLISGQANNPGYLPAQILLHGAEAGDEGSFFNHKDEVLSIAADLGYPGDTLKALSQAIDEYKTISEVAGQRMVDKGLMDPDTFGAHAGTWVRRIYRTNLSDPMAREALVKQMADNGIDDTRANGILLRLQAAGESGPEGQVGTGLKTVGNNAKQYQRNLSTPEERMAFMPEYNALDVANNSLLSQFKAAGIHGALNDLAGDTALSAANQIKNYAAGQQINFTQTNRIKNMAADVMEQIKAHQDTLTNNLEKEYNTRQKWVADQQEAAAKAAQSLSDHQATEPQKPLSPLVPQQAQQAQQGGSFSGGSPRRYRPADAVPITREEAAPGRTENTGLSFKKPNLTNILQNIKDVAEKAQYDKNSRQFVQDLADWQDKHLAWQKRAATLTQKVTDRQAELARRQPFLDQTEQSVNDWFNEAERLQRRHDLLRGAAPTDAHANDALSQVEEKLGFQVADPIERQKWFASWKNAWTTRTLDIFDQRNVNPPVAPKGFPDELVRRVDQNIIPAVALDNTLSADANAFSADNHPPGWELWDGKGNRDYGAMEGRWGPSVVRSLIEDAIDPARYTKNGLANPYLKFVAAMARQYKALHLYYNPSTKAGIFIQSFWDAKATANAEGVAFNPAAYIRGMKEYKSWVEGNGPMTPPVEAMMRGASELGGGYSTGINPEDLPKVGQESAWRRFASGNQKRFLELHQFPKAGLAAVLTDAGYEPAAAGQIADNAFNARAASGGIATHGVQQMLETANRYGISIFTSYPLHSINRFFQLMAQKPEVLAPYPVIRNYLVQAAGQQAQNRDNLGEIEPKMVPIPGMKDAQGNPVWLDASALIPYEGAMRQNPFGIGASSIIGNLLGGGNKRQLQGANPGDIENEAIRQAYFTLAPGVAGRQADTMLRALGGQTQTPFSINAPTPLMAAGAFAGLPMKWEENATDRRLGMEKVAIPSRVQYQNLYIQRLEQEKETPQDYSGYLKKMDIQALYGAQRSAQKYLANLSFDKSVDDSTAKTMIRRQIDYIASINRCIQDQANLAAAQQAQEGEGNNEGF